MLKQVEAVAASLRLQPIAIAVKNRGDFGDAFAEISSARVDALFVSETMTSAARRQIVDFAVTNGQPARCMNRDYLAAGGLMAYAPAFADAFPRVADYGDRFLRVSDPSELPAAQP